MELMSWSKSHHSTPFALFSFEIPWVIWWLVEFYCLVSYAISDIGSMLHYSDVIMSAMTSQTTGVSIFYSTTCSGTDQNIKAPPHWPSWGDFNGDRWIPCTKGQWRGKCFQLMTSSCKQEFLPCVHIESFGFEKHTTDESQTSDETGLVF